MQVRRVVTGHDEAGRAIVTIDEVCKNKVSRRPQHESYVVWSTGEFPSDNATQLDGAARAVSGIDPKGTVFRVIEYGPGVAPRNHRTESLDYAVVMSGEIDMDIDGVEVHLRAGDVLVQRGTVHNWINRGSVPCVIAFVLVAAHAVASGDKLLGAAG
jgi:mannose-6-phosphate isomerase-like protein (cupin superfamily)